MKGHMVITIGRQFGSGGREIGGMLATKLGIPFYDRELLMEAAQDSGVSREMFERADEQPSNSFLYSLSLGGVAAGGSMSVSTMDILSNDKLFALQADTIQRIASEHSCVMIGRCADYILREHENLVSVFIRADDDYRIGRICEEFDFTPDIARQRMRKIDRRRASHYGYYSDRSWGDVNNYDMCLNSAKLGCVGTVDMILNLIKLCQTGENT